MYKLISNNIVVDVVSKPIYARYSREARKMVPSNISTADAILGSDYKTYYALQGRTPPAEKSHWKTVSVVGIGEREYASLKQSLQQHQVIYNNKKVLTTAQDLKIAEMKIKCNEAITNGIEITTKDGIRRKFSLTIEDQINLMDISMQMSDGKTSFLYHSDGNVCEVFSADEMSKILEAVSIHRNFHTTYFNLLKYCINNMTDIEKISAIRYGDSLLSLDIPQSVKTFVKERLDGQ
jgi:hypothetical protein